MWRDQISLKAVAHREGCLSLLTTLSCPLAHCLRRKKAVTQRLDAAVGRVATRPTLLKGTSTRKHLRARDHYSACNAPFVGNVKHESFGFTRSHAKRLFSQSHRSDSVSSHESCYRAQVVCMLSRRKHNGHAASQACDEGTADRLNRGKRPAVPHPITEAQLNPGAGGPL